MSRKELSLKCRESLGPLNARKEEEEWGEWCFSLPRLLFESLFELKCGSEGRGL